MVETKCEFQLQVLAAANRAYIFFVGRGSKSARTHIHKHLIGVLFERARSRTLCGGGVDRGGHVRTIVGISLSPVSNCLFDSPSVCVLCVCSRVSVYSFAAHGWWHTQTWNRKAKARQRQNSLSLP